MAAPQKFTHSFAIRLIMCSLRCNHKSDNITYIRNVWKYAWTIHDCHFSNKMSCTKLKFSENTIWDTLILDCNVKNFFPYTSFIIKPITFEMVAL